MSRGIILPVLIGIAVLGLIGFSNDVYAGESQITNSPAFETTPTLARDSTGLYVVYTSQSLVGGSFAPGEIYFQRLNDDGTPNGVPILISSSLTNNQLNDAHGDFIVYSAFASTGSATGQIQVYQISTGITTSLSTSTTVFEARIHGTQVAWVEGSPGATSIMRFDLTQLGTSIPPQIIAGPTPPASAVEVGDRFVVWEDVTGGQQDIRAFDLNLGVIVDVSIDPGVAEFSPSTSGQWITFAALNLSTASQIDIIAQNLDTAETRIVISDGSFNGNPTIDGQFIGYESNFSGNSDTYVHNLQSAQNTQVTTHPADQFLNNVFDGVMAYVDNRAGDFDIYTSLLDVDQDGFIPPADCDDSNAAINPLAIEILDGVDNNCDGQVDEGFPDTDGDGIPDIVDNCASTPNSNQSDVDVDGIGDACDNAPNTFNPDQSDVDGDGVGDVIDNCEFIENEDQADADNDGVGDACDNSPNDSNPDQSDVDNDGVGDVSDNCASTPNSNQSDIDGDGTGDACDVCPSDEDNDVDGDGLCADVDACPDEFGDGTDGCPIIPPTPVPTSTDHYLAYDVKETKHTDKFEKMTVTLTDQFETDRIYTVEKPHHLYNPVDKNGEGISDEISHLLGYKIKTPKDSDKFEKVTNVLVQNQFGDIVVDVKKPKLLLVPSAKDHFTVPGELNPITINHFKCYDVKETKDTPKFVKRAVTVNDPNFEITKDFEVKKPKQLCTPVDKNGEGIVDAENYLMCYDLKKMKGEPKFEKRNVFTNNQFGLDDLEVKKQHQLCVPSKILE